MSESEPRWWTPGEVAARWKISVREVQRMAIEGELAHFRAGRQIRIGSDTVLAFEQANTQRARSRHVRR